MLHPMARRAPAIQRAPDPLKYSHAIPAAAAAGSALQRALLAALRLRRPQLLERLAQQSGAQDFAQALAALSTRQMADALSLLPPAQRAAVCAQLPRPCGGTGRRWPPAALPRPRPAQRRRRACCPGAWPGPGACAHPGTRPAAPARLEQPRAGRSHPPLTILSPFLPCRPCTTSTPRPR